MNWRWLLFLMVLTLALVSCDGGEETPTPDSAGISPPNRLELAELARNPASYEGQRVEVSGSYGILPAPPCNAALFLSPATWSFSDGGVVIRAAGMEDILTSLAPDGLTLLAGGLWQRWEGPIGCGDAAVTSTIWYLQIDQIISPNPISRSTLTPIGAPPPDLTLSPTSAQQVMISPTAVSTPATSVGSPTPLATSTTVTIQPETTASASPTTTPSPTLSPSPSPTGQPSPTPSPTGLTSPIATPTDMGSPIATPTLTGTIWPTFTPAATDTPSPSPSAAPSETINDQGSIEYDQVENRLLGAGETHRWSLDVNAGDVVTVSIGPAIGLDLKIELIDPQGATIASRDEGSTGQAEIIAGLELSMGGEYGIRVRATNGLSGDYSIAASESNSYVDILFPGNIIYGETTSEFLPFNSHHIWHFQGTAGDTITILLTPYDNSDLVFTLFSPTMEGVPDMVYQYERIDDYGAGDSEEASYDLDENGFYSIWVEEWSDGESNYELALTQQ